MLMSEVPRLREIAEGLDPIMPDVDIATAMIAEIDPRELDLARARAYREAGLGRLMRPKITLEAQEAEAEFDRVTMEPSSDESKKEARERLERLLAEETSAGQIEHEERIELSLAHAIDRKRKYLAKPMRRAAEVTCALALGSMAGLVAPEMMYDVAHNPKTLAAEAKKHEIKVKLDTGEKIAAVVWTGGIAIMGGFMGYIVTDGRKLDRAYARRRAQKIVERSQHY